MTLKAFGKFQLGNKLGGLKPSFADVGGFRGSALGFSQVTVPQGLVESFSKRRERERERERLSIDGRLTFTFGLQFSENSDDNFRYEVLILIDLRLGCSLLVFLMFSCEETFLFRLAIC